ncbi:hypothetical protein M5689_000939 [Euphorbia peplus]|nr:hypothetical protein M5689_000939 [Euphorbia peplus]
MSIVPSFSSPCLLEEVEAPCRWYFGNQSREEVRFCSVRSNGFRRWALSQRSTKNGWSKVLLESDAKCMVNSFSGQVKLICYLPALRS